MSFIVKFSIVLKDAGYIWILFSHRFFDGLDTKLRPAKKMTKPRIMAKDDFDIKGYLAESDDN